MTTPKHQVSFVKSDEIEQLLQLVVMLQ